MKGQWEPSQLYKVVWIHGSLNVKADVALWWVDQDDWELNDHVLVTMHAHLSDWVVDHFTDHLNTSTPMLTISTACSGCLGQRQSMPSHRTGAAA
jgi:hypothetical protein